MKCSNAETLIRSALLRSDQALHAQLGPPEPLAGGMVYCDPRFPDLPDANQLRDQLLGDLPCDEAFAQVEAFFAARSRRCLRWTLSPDQPVAPVESRMASLGWIRRERVLFGQQHLSAAELVGPAATAPPPGLRILPARAMRRAFAQTFADSAADPARHEMLAAERLDDANFDAFVATLSGEPAGRVALLETGDICRVHDLYIIPHMRRRGLARALLRHVLQLAYRLRPRIVVADAIPATPDEKTAIRRLLGSFGLEEAGRIIEWQRP